MAVNNCLKYLRSWSFFGVFIVLSLPAAAQDSLVADITDTLPVVPTTGLAPLQVASSFKGHSINEVPLKYVERQPYVSLQQMLKGNAAGVYIQEPSGEPGTEQNIFIRGISSPLLSKRELFDQQPAIFVNGIPIIQDNPFIYEIQKYDFNREGPATNLLASLNQDNIESIEVIKDPVTLSSLGSMAANGAIWITTKNARSGERKINVNSYFGYALQPDVFATNAARENQFRQPFYNRFGTLEDRLNYPPYLRDSTNRDYYGPADWADLYYDNVPLYNLDASISGGSDRANFRFLGGLTKNANPADKTSFTRYNGSFFINVAPVKWLMMSSMLGYTRQDRDRNRNIRDRLAEQRYIPDLTNPLTPNSALYGAYLSQFNDAFDKNTNNLVQGYIAIAAKPTEQLTYSGRLGFDYNEGIRDVFWPTTLLEGNNFVSNYFGYNQRLAITNSVAYDFYVGATGTLTLKGGQNFVSDVYKYDYAYANNTPNDFTKINVVTGDPNKADYLTPRGILVNYFPGKMRSRLVSFFGNAVYSYNEKLKLNAVVSREGSSNMQPDQRWFTNYSAGVEWDLKRSLLADAGQLSSFLVTASWGHIGKLLSDDRFNAGPAYRVDMGFTNEPTFGSYAGLGGLSRPYTSGWVGYGIPWAYTDQLNAGVRLGLLADRLMLGLDVYKKSDKDMLLPVPVASEWGYTGAYKSGLEVSNTGLDLSLSAVIFPAKENAFSWLFTGNLNYNKNKLAGLPDGLSEVTIGATKLEIGKPVDAFWLLTNNGVYNTDAEVPVNPSTSKPITYKGVALKAGDPRWLDVNGDYIINDDDKTLQGNYLPKISGGFGSGFTYHSFSLDFQCYFALGRKVLNQYASSRLDFINTEANNNINSVKEITFWEEKQDLTGYPIYNPWSSVVPYRIDQNLFLDNASYLKLRSVSVGYDLSKGGTKTTFDKCLIYLTGTNLLTLSPFKGDDPELANYNGIYNGYGLPLPRSLIVGLKLDF
ncbi:SusC/RagA family TonB-linked outer membrane protein [Niabella aurantiaca]|uniref:SusC/RagA family TonB-linked outer membrane protein n=1 Tax=Niabella aurantiaca TaxID=379900 RepID=UPI00036B8887|nr:SusC/RagA family TonB-linked outer membrane protein [Niabella aurantiaca]